MAKPFVKWAGGKGKLLKTLEKYLPSDFERQESITYIEPFVGGGAMLFHMLETFPNIRVSIRQTPYCHTEIFVVPLPRQN